MRAFRLGLWYDSGIRGRTDPPLGEETAMATDHEARQQQNDLSRNKAKHHREPWSEEEHEFLNTFWDQDNVEGSLLEISEALGRTVEACRQRYYCPNGISEPRSEPKHQSGWLIGFCQDCGRFTDVLCSGLSQRCEDCQ